MFKLLAIGIISLLGCSCSFAQQNGNTEWITEKQDYQIEERVTIGFKLKKGMQYSLCQDYLANMNRVAPDTGLYCGVSPWFDEKGKKAGFREIPWEEVDKEDYKEALWGWYRSAPYFDRRYPNPEVKRLDFENEFMQRKFTLWKGRININNGGETEIVLMLLESCENTSMAGSTFVITRNGTYDFDFGNGVSGDPFWYDGRVFLAKNHRMGHDVIEPFDSGLGPDKVNDMRAVCKFERLLEDTK